MSKEIIESVCFRGETFNLDDSVIQKTMYVLGTPLKGAIAGFTKKHGKIRIKLQGFEDEFLLLYFQKSIN